MKCKKCGSKKEVSLSNTGSICFICLREKKRKKRYSFRVDDFDFDLIINEYKTIQKFIHAMVEKLRGKT